MRTASAKHGYRKRRKTENDTNAGFRATSLMASGKSSAEKKVSWSAM